MGRGEHPPNPLSYPLLQEKSAGSTHTNRETEVGGSERFYPGEGENRPVMIPTTARRPAVSRTGDGKPRFQAPSPELSFSLRRRYASAPITERTTMIPKTIIQIGRPEEVTFNSVEPGVDLSTGRTREDTSTSRVPVPNPSPSQSCPSPFFLLFPLLLMLLPTLPTPLRPVERGAGIQVLDERRAICEGPRAEAGWRWWGHNPDPVNPSLAASYEPLLFRP